MKYEAGQKVMILHNLEEGTGKYGHTYCNDEMVEYAGKVVTLQSYSGANQWRIKEDRQMWSWNALMFTTLDIDPDLAFSLYLRGSICESQYTKLMRKGGQV